MPRPQLTPQQEAKVEEHLRRAAEPSPDSVDLDSSTALAVSQHERLP